MKWIPLSERTPEESRWVLVTTEQDYGYKMVRLCFFDKHTHQFEDNGYPIALYRVLAWMPVPDPY